MALQLGVNTCLNRGELLLMEGEKYVDRLCWEKARSHSQVITHQFLTLMERNQAPMGELTLIQCVKGPGSFTGLRVGVNFAKTLAYSLNIPIQGINQLDLQAASSLSQNPSPLPVISLLDAQKNSIFCSLFDFSGPHPQVLFENQVVAIKDLRELVSQEMLVCGDGLVPYAQALKRELRGKLKFSEKREFSLADLIHSPLRERNSQTCQWFEFQPLYIKASAPEEKLICRSQKV